MAKKKKSKPQPADTAVAAKVKRSKSSGPYYRLNANKILRRSYDGASYSRIWADWVTGQNSANSELYSILPMLRERCRDLARNNPYAGGAIETICDNVLGTCGFKFQSKAKKIRGKGYNKPAIAQIEDLMRHALKADHIDVRGVCDFPQLERLVLRTWVESGEVLIRKHRKRFGRSKVPYAIQVLEPDYLVDDVTITLKNSSSEVIMGVQVDGLGRREGYWLYKRHPGDRLTRSVDRAEIEFVPASEIEHIFLCDRPEQLRGIPWLAIAIKRLHFMGDCEDAELVAAKLAAFVGGIIKTNNPEAFGDTVLPQVITDTEQPASEDSSTEQPDERTFVDFEPGQLLKLFNDEDFEAFNNNRPNAALPDFMKHILRGIASGILGISYSELTGDFSDASYSSHRAEKLKLIRSVKRIQYELKARFNSKITIDLIDTAWLSNLIDLQGYALNEDAYQAHDWISEAFDWIDPQKDIAAAISAIESGLSTYQIELGRLGLDLEEVIEQRAAEMKMLIDAGLMADPAAQEEAKSGTVTPLAEGLSAVRSALEAQSPQIQEIMRSLDQVKDEPIREAIAALIERSAGHDLPVGARLTPIPLRQVKRGKKCKKGILCGNSCQSRKNACWVGLSAEQKKLAQKARAAMKKGEVGDAVELPASSTSISADMQSMRAALASDDLDTFTEIASQVYEKAKTKAENDGIDFYDNLSGGNGQVDPILNLLVAEAGFDGLPEQMDKATMDALDTTENLVFYRSTSKTQQRFQKRFDDMRTGPHNMGRGIYCSGLYVGANYDGLSGQDALNATLDYGEGTMKFSIKRSDLNIVKRSQLENEQEAAGNKLTTWRNKKIQQIQVDQSDVDAAKSALQNQKASTHHQFTIGTKRSSTIQDVRKVTMTDDAGNRTELLGDLVVETDNKTKKVTYNAWSEPSTGVTDLVAFDSKREAVTQLIEWNAEAEVKKSVPEYKQVQDSYRRSHQILMGDDDDLGSGRFAVMQGYDFVDLEAYNKTYGLFLNRTKATIQSTPSDRINP